MTNEEFLRLIAQPRAQSDIIIELARRLEAELDKDRSGEWDHDCPVCNAPLTVNIDNAEELSLEAKND